MYRCTTYAQVNISEYLKTHHYAFSLDNGFDSVITDTLKSKFSGYKLILQAEGGSHFLKFYTVLTFVWIKFLNENFRLTHFFLEAGHSSDIQLNKYLQKGDSCTSTSVRKSAFNVSIKGMTELHWREAGFGLE